MIFRTKRIELALLLTGCALTFYSTAQTPPSPKPATPATPAATTASPVPAAKAKVRPGKKIPTITLNFSNAEIEAVARTLAPLNGRNLIVDPRVKGTINLTTEKPVSASEAWDQFLATLRIQGFAVIETQGLYKILPEAEAKQQGGSIAVVPAGTSVSNGQVMTQIFKLNHENANNLVAILRPLISPNNTINVSAGTNALVITDYADNLQRMERIISALDVSNASDVEVIPLQYATAMELLPLLNRLIENANAANPASGASPGGTSPEGGYKTTLLAEPRSNSIILRAANNAREAQVRDLIKKLDRPGSALTSGNIHVVYLKNAEAAKLVGTLRAALAADGHGSAAGVGSGSPPLTPAPQPISTNTGSSLNSGSVPTLSLASPSNSTQNLNSTGGQIQADTSTNALIITAPEPQFRQIRAVIDMLDTRRAQVMVESLIAEVDSTKEAQFGIQWQNVIGNKNSSMVGVMGTNFNAGGNNLINLETGLGKVLPGAGLNIGTGRKVNGQFILTSLANFLQTAGDSNVLSRPTLLTLDNEEAKIVVGQNVPFVTGQYTNNNTVNGSVNPFQTIERKDVGLTLRVKPQISDNGTIKLTIFQEVSSIDATAVSTLGLITDKRSIESNVLVQDGGIIVLGGLLSDSYQGTRDQVPGLGNLSFFGSLFRSETRNRAKTNLMVFLRPVVVRDADSAEALSLGRYKDMIQLQKDSQVEASPVLTITNNATLPTSGANQAPANAATTTPPATPTNGSTSSPVVKPATPPTPKP